MVNEEVIEGYAVYKVNSCHERQGMALTTITASKGIQGSKCCDSDTYKVNVLAQLPPGVTSQSFVVVPLTSIGALDVGWVTDEIDDSGAPIGKASAPAASSMQEQGQSQINQDTLLGPCEAICSAAGCSLSSNQIGNAGAGVSDECEKDTGGSCNLLSCEEHRGPTDCVGGSISNDGVQEKRCLCKKDYCASNGVCYPTGPQDLNKEECRKCAECLDAEASSTQSPKKAQADSANGLKAMTTLFALAVSSACLLH